MGKLTGNNSYMVGKILPLEWETCWKNLAWPENFRHDGKKKRGR
jgi:hypothetical protein